MDGSKNKLVVAVLFAFATSDAAVAARYASAGMAARDVMDLPPMTLASLQGKTGAIPSVGKAPHSEREASSSRSETQPKDVAPSSTGSVAVETLLDWNAMPVGEFLSRASMKKPSPQQQPVTPSDSPSEPADNPVSGVSVAAAKPEVSPPSEESDDEIKVRVVKDGKTKTATADVDASPAPQKPAGPEPGTTAYQSEVNSMAAQVRRALAKKPESASGTGEAKAAERLVIERKAKKLHIEPKALRFPEVGQTVQVSMPDATAGLSLFVRDEAVVSWEAASGQLAAEKTGATEIYVVSPETMYIVPVSVEPPKSQWNLDVPQSLVSLEGVLGPANSKDTGRAASYERQAEKDDDGGKKGEAPASGPSLKQSLAETRRTLDQQNQKRHRFATVFQDSSHSSLTVQVVDERSFAPAGKVYPVGGAEIHVVGTEFTAETDETGHLTIQDVPDSSRFFVTIKDPHMRIRPGIAEVATRKGRDGVVRLRVMRDYVFDMYTRLVDETQDSRLGSFCATATQGEERATPAAGIEVELNVAATGPFYFDKYGFLDPGLGATGDDGRFCYFNVEPGPAALSFYDEGAYWGALPMPVFAGRHYEDTVHLSATDLTTRLGVMPTAHEQLADDPAVARAYREVATTDLYPVGGEDRLSQADAGLMRTPEASVMDHRGQALAYVEASDFEPVLYTYDLWDEGIPVTPLIPRGFVEDLSYYSQVYYDPVMGSVLAEHGRFANQGQGPVHIRLVNAAGRDVGDGWYFGDGPVTKAVFFNVPVGTYSLVVETDEGYWLQTETIMVYSETVSYVRTGSPLQYQPHEASRSQSSGD